MIEVRVIFRDPLIENQLLGEFGTIRCDWDFESSKSCDHQGSLWKYATQVGCLFLFRSPPVEEGNIEQTQMRSSIFSVRRVRVEVRFRVGLS